ncbi:hypothetical protein STRTUCAR8_09339, partial [Streptomyces turgidiscabies Car8]
TLPRAPFKGRGELREHLARARGKRRRTPQSAPAAVTSAHRHAPL